VGRAPRVAGPAAEVATGGLVDRDQGLDDQGAGECGLHRVRVEDGPQVAGRSDPKAPVPVPPNLVQLDGPVRARAGQSPTARSAMASSGSRSS